MPAASFSTSVIIRDCLHAECNPLSHSPEAIERHLRLHGSAKSARNNHDNLVFKPLKLCVKHGGQLASPSSSRYPSASPGGSARFPAPITNNKQLHSILNAHDVIRLQHSQFLTSRRPTPPSQRPNALLFNSFAALSHANPALCLAHVLPPPKRDPLPPQGKLDSAQTDPDPDSVENVLGETMPIHRYLRVRRKHKRRVPGDDDGAAAARRLVSKLKKSTGITSKLPQTPSAMLKDEPILTLNLDLEMIVPESLGTIGLPKNGSNINPNLRPSSTKSGVGSSRSGTATSRSSVRSAGSKDETSSRASDALDDWEGNEQLMLDEEEDLGNINAPMLLNRAITAMSSKPMTAGSTGGGGVAAVLDMFPNGDDGVAINETASPTSAGQRAASGAAEDHSQQAAGVPVGPPVIDRTAMALAFLTSAPGRTTADPRVLAVLDTERESTIAGLLDLQANHAEEMATTEAEDEVLFTFMNDILVLLMMQRVRATGAISVQYDAQIHDVLLDPLASAIRMTWTTCEYLRVIHSPPLFPSAIFSQLVSIVNDSTLDDRAKRKRARLLCRRHLRKQSPTSALLFRSILSHVSRILVLAEALPRRDPHRKWLQYRLAIGLIPAVVQEGWTEDLPAHMRIVHLPTSVADAGNLGQTSLPMRFWRGFQFLTAAF
ncbi:hypothetical protein BCR44DRAFT_54895 [Catenaria anguillulae PL171]|uniref:Uncharacterized protein n=1 Tax=Catenaria anguillulae PL171 TaxID=765915 RepID=A0A1Y2HCD1_9FUNG|nr:hypothetical protein BCR44DRAFT_54895 [Catenaria anguillulae PL171]